MQSAHHSTQKYSRSGNCELRGVAPHVPSGILAPKSGFYSVVLAVRPPKKCQWFRGKNQSASPQCARFLRYQHFDYKITYML